MPEVIARGVEQSVAVIDGVCVEVKRHVSKRLTEEGEEERGLFIACGAKVASKVTITVDGIEAYFNALAAASCEGGLAVRRPFEENCVSFPLRSSGKLLPLSSDPRVDRAKLEHLLGGKFCRSVGVSLRVYRPPVHRTCPKVALRHDFKPVQSHPPTESDQLRPTPTELGQSWSHLADILVLGASSGVPALGNTS